MRRPWGGTGLWPGGVPSAAGDGTAAAKYEKEAQRMYILPALLLLALSTAVHLAAFVGARRVIGRASSDVKRLTISFAAARGVAGVAGWYLAGSLLFAVGVLWRGETVIDETSMRVIVVPSGPAARAGVRDGDRIVSVAGERITSWDQLKSIVARHGEEAVLIEIDRGNERLTLSATAEGPPPRLRVGPWTETRSASVGHAIVQGLVQPGKLVAMTVRSFVRMISGREATELSGPVGIVKETSSAANHGLLTGLLLATRIASYMLPLVALGSAIYELLNRRHELARVARRSDP